MYRFERLVPLIGATVAGPLDVLMLPRTWLKSVLSAAGMLPEGYFDNDKGFNHRVVEDLGLEPEAFFAFLATMPTYPQAEDYVKAHATKLDAATIAAHNSGIESFLRPAEMCGPVRARVGITDADYRNSAILLNYDDWFSIHEEIIAHRSESIEPIVPMVSSGQMGMLGIPHLPRLWIKATLRAVGALKDGWKSGLECGFDKKVSGLIGLDLAATSAYIGAELPNYLEFEGWVSDHIAAPDAATKAKWVTDIISGQKGEEQGAAEVIEAGAPGLTLRGTVLLNDMVDWKHMHDHIVSRRAVRA